MQKFEIEADCVPGGYRAVAYRKPKGGESYVFRGFLIHDAVACTDSREFLIVEPISEGEGLQDINEVRGASLKKLEQACSSLGNRVSATEEAQQLHMTGVCDRLEELAKRIQALEKAAEPPAQEPERWGLWGHWPGESAGYWYTLDTGKRKGEHGLPAMTFPSEKHAWCEYAGSSFAPYPYPADGGPPLELRGKPDKEKWGLWWVDDERWAISGGEVYVADSRDEACRELKKFPFSEKAKPYPYPADGGKPMELRNKPKPYGLWNLAGEHWHSGSPFESAGDASRYASKSFYADWRNYWRVYPWPEDGGKPMELRTDRPTVYYVRNKKTGNFLRRTPAARNTLFSTEDQALAEHMAQGTEGGPYEVYPVVLGE